MCECEVELREQNYHEINRRRNRRQQDRDRDRETDRHTVKKVRKRAIPKTEIGTRSKAKTE